MPDIQAVANIASNWNAADSRNLLAFTARNEEILREFSQRVKDEILPADSEEDIILRCLFLVLIRWYGSNSTIPPRLVLEQESLRMLSEVLPGDSYQQDLITELDVVYSIPSEDLVVSYGFQLLQAFLHKYILIPRLQRLSDLSTITESDWSELVEAKQLSEPAVGRVVDTTADPFELLTAAATHVPTGVSFIDHLLGGGPTVGDLIGFLAPFKGGKTTTANQLAITLAKSGKNVVFIYAERPIAAHCHDFWTPVSSFITGISKSRLTAIQSSGRPVREVMTEDERTRYECEWNRVRPNLQYVDYYPRSDNPLGNGGMSEIDRLIRRRQQDSGRSVDYLVIDWLGVVASRWHQLGIMFKGKSNDKIQVYTRIMHELAALAAQHACTIWINHQLAPYTLSGSNPFPSADQSHEFKSFGFYVTCCLTLGKRDSNEIAPMVTSAARSIGTGSYTFVQLQGDNARFRHLDANYIWNKGERSWSARGATSGRRDVRSGGGSSFRVDDL